jgi:hypothetical protein
VRLEDCNFERKPQWIVLPSVGSLKFGRRGLQVQNVDVLTI